MTTQETLENVEKALSEIRPFLESDGGNIKLPVSYTHLTLPTICSV